MKGILINPFDETIKEVEYTGNWRDISLLIDCELYDIVVLSDEDTMYIDDDGLLKNNNRYFSWDGRNFEGKGLIIGNRSGEGTDNLNTTFELQEVIDRVEFLPDGHRETPYMEFRVLE